MNEKIIDMNTTATSFVDIKSSSNGFYYPIGDENINRFMGRQKSNHRNGFAAFSSNDTKSSTVWSKIGSIFKAKSKGLPP